MVTLAGLEPATSPRSPDWKQGRSVPLELQRHYDPYDRLWRRKGADEARRIAADISTRQRQSKPDFDFQSAFFQSPVGGAHAPYNLPRGIQSATTHTMHTIRTPIAM